MDNTSVTVKMWTTAPVAYDGFGTIRTGNVRDIHSGRKVEEVIISDDNLYWQTMRYSSGNHICVSEKRVDEFIF